jgi:hypothetical protein
MKQRRPAAFGASIEEIVSSILSHIGDSGQKERHVLRFFNYTGTIRAQEVR